MVCSGRVLASALFIVLVLSPQSVLSLDANPSETTADPVSSLGSPTASATPVPSLLPTAEPDPGPWFVRFTPDHSLPAVGTALGTAQVAKAFPLLHGVRLAGEVDADLIQALPGVQSATREHRASVASVPNDPLRSAQTHHTIIDSYGAWSLTHGDPDIKVAIIDSGIDQDHLDLFGRIGPGKDFIADETTDDDCGHGTHVAGLLGAHLDNGLGIAGVSKATLLPARVMRPDPLTCAGQTADVAEAVLWAKDQGAQIAVLALEVDGNDATLENAIQQATAAGMLIIASAGNTYGGDVAYPAAYEDVLAVTSLASDGSPSVFSAQGTAIDIGAPGRDLLSTVPADQYERRSGTSMAAPLVAGTAALMMSLNLALDTATIRAMLEATARDVGATGIDPQSGHGMLDSGEALRAVDATLEHAPYLAPYANGVIKIGGSYVHQPYVFDPDGDPLTITLDQAPAGATIQPDGTVRWTPKPADIGSHHFAVSASDGTHTVARQFTIQVKPNQVPVASFTGPSIVEMTQAALMDASGSSDADDAELTFAWDKDASDGLQFASSTGQAIALTWDAPGTYTVTLRVTDPYGGTATTTGEVIVDDTLAAKPYFSLQYGPNERIQGMVRVDWVGSADESAVDLEFVRMYTAAGTRALLSEQTGLPEGQTFRMEVPADGRVFIDLPPDLSAAGIERNLLGHHVLRFTLTLAESQNGDSEQLVFDVPYGVALD